MRTPRPPVNSEEGICPAAAQLAQSCTAIDLISLLTSSGDVVAHLDSAGNVVSILGDSFFEEMRDAVTGVSFTSIASEEHASIVEKLLMDASQSSSACSARVRLNRMSRMAWAELRVLRATHPNLGYIAVLRNAAETIAAEEKYQRYASHDVLTRLPNRMLLAAQVRAAASAGQVFGMIGININEFKKVNASLGLAAGDALLKMVSQRLAAIARTDDVLARTNGDEFAVLARNLNSAEGVKAVSQRMLTTLRSPFEYQGHTVYLSASVGAALYPQHGATADTLIANLGKALNVAKEMGPNNYALAKIPEDTPQKTSVSLESEMYQAIQLGEFHLDYQPLINAQSGEIQGFEALMRWTRADGERISPAEFIPMAERNGLINLLGNWALNSACAELLALQSALGREAYISVNVSPVQFRSPKLKANVMSALELSGLPGHQLMLEITEGALMADPVRSEEVLQELVALGVRIAIDDFGTGYSSLAYLKSFPISILKVDRTFIKDLPSSTKDDAICRTVLGLANLLNLKTVAEGVETKEQLELLKNYGCDAIQGYFTGRPASPQALKERLSAQNLKTVE